MCAGVIIPSAMMSEDERKSTSATAPASFWLGLLLAFALGCVLKFVAIVSGPLLLASLSGCLLFLG